MSLRGDQRGFTLIEVMVGMVIALVAVAGTTSVIAKSTRNSLGQQREVQSLALAEQEVEAARSIVKRFGFEALALSAAPVGVGPVGEPNPSNPLAFVSGTTLTVPLDFTAATTGTPRSEPLVVGGTGAYPTPGRVQPLTAAIAVGNLRADVHRFVSRPSMPASFCPTAGACDGDARRVTIAVVPRLPGAAANSTGGEAELQRTKPIYLTTILTAGVPKNKTGAGTGLSIGVSIP